MPHRLSEALADKERQAPAIDADEMTSAQMADDEAIIGGLYGIEYRDSRGGNGRYYGWMVKMGTGTYVHLRVNGGIVSLDQRKAKAALERAEKIAARTQEQAAEGEVQWAELARDVAQWRGYLTLAEAAKVLGLPTRTLEGIEQGRGFRYPQLLRLAMNAPAAQARQAAAHPPAPEDAT